MRFESPYAFLLLLLIPALLYWNLRQRGPTLRLSSLMHARAAGYSLRQHFARMPLLVRVLALVLFIIALARPQEGRERVQDVSEGIAIMMVADRSGSMGEEMDYHGQAMTKIDVVKKVFAQFLFGGQDGLEGRPNDLVGLVSFARYADTNCPLTLGHSVLAHLLERVELPQTREEDGTAIGDAMALAAARLKTAEDEMKEERKLKGDAYRIKSKIMILLTDGQNNRGERQPMEAAALAAEWGIKVYAIGVGGGGGVVMNTPLGPIRMGGGAGFDEDTLKAIATKTGGQYFRANDGEALSQVYETIGQLEKSEIHAERYLDYREWFAPFAVAGLLLLAFEIFLSCTVFRRVP